MVKTMIPFPVGNQSNDPVVFGRRLAVIRGAAKIMAYRINHEGSVVNKGKPPGDCNQKCSQTMSQQCAYNRWENYAGTNGPQNVMAVLMHEHLFDLKVSDEFIRDGVLAHQQPAQMGVEETLLNVIGVLIGVDKPVVLPMLGRPLKNGLLKRTGAK